jgi:hypothetical protein
MLFCVWKVLPFEMLFLEGQDGQTWKHHVCMWKMTQHIIAYLTSPNLTSLNLISPNYFSLTYLNFLSMHIGCKYKELNPKPSQ